MLSDEARREIRDLIRQHTARNTTNAKTARDALVRRGVYTAQGDLTPEYGGEASDKADEPKR